MGEKMATEWKDLHPDVLRVMKSLGKFGPTVRPELKEIKGYTYDEDGDGGKEYMGPEDLRQIARACEVVADWLEVRAAEFNVLQEQGGN